MNKSQKTGLLLFSDIILRSVIVFILIGLYSTFPPSPCACSVQQDVVAGLTFSEQYDHTTGEYNVTILWSQEGTVTEINAIKPDGSKTPAITKIGEDINVVGREGETIRITGTLDDGTEGIIQEYEIGG